MPSYIFQAKLGDQTKFGEIDLRRQPAVGEIISWNAQRFRSLMQPNDLVFFWQAGGADIRGIHGWGRLVSSPYEEDDGHQVDVRFEHRLSPHIAASELNDDPKLEELQIFTVRVGSNFLLEEGDVNAILEHIPTKQRPKLRD